MITGSITLSENITEDQINRNELDQPRRAEGNNISDIGRSLKSG